MARQSTQIIGVTGTKGKTTVVRALAYALNKVLREPVLSTDTDQVLLGKRVCATAAQSIENSGYLPTVCPGRFLGALAKQKSPVAVFEESLGCGRGAGTGYRRHKVGVFTNVFDDHIGNRPDLQSRNDIARVKSFIFKKIQRGGFAVYNSDDKLVVGQLSVIDPSLEVSLVACGFGDRPKNCDVFVTAANGEICVYEGKYPVQKIKISRFKWLLGGDYEPTLRNAMFVVAALYGFFKTAPRQFAMALIALEKYKPKATGGRMVVAQSKRGYKVILDFAHEAKSLSDLGKYAKTLTASGGKVIGVVRLSGERQDSYIKTTTKAFAPNYDHLIIYDKIDGHWRQSTKHVTKYRYRRDVGEVSALMLKVAQGTGVPAGQVIREDHAMQQAAKLARKGDAVVCIINRPDRSYDLARRIFKLKA